MSKWIVLHSAPKRIHALRLKRVQRPPTWRSLSSTSRSLQQHSDPRIRELGREICDEYATLRDSYGKPTSSTLSVPRLTLLGLPETPKHPIVLAHGLLGFSEFQVSTFLPAVQYWHGIKDALNAQGASVICASVPPSSSIEERAAKLRDDVEAAAEAAATTDRAVNIIAHSMGGLDARYMISHLPPRNVDIASLVTIASPHRGSHFADFLYTDGSPVSLPKLYPLIERLGLGTAAFAQLTQRYMTQTFNPSTPDRPSTRYFSYGAATQEPPFLSPFRPSWRLIEEAEGPNDGLVSVESSQWGTYKGTLVGVSHLDLINWSNRMRWTVREWMGIKRTFNAIAFYLDISDMLAKEGL